MTIYVVMIGNPPRPHRALYLKESVARSVATRRRNMLKIPAFVVALDTDVRKPVADERTTEERFVEAEERMMHWSFEADRLQRAMNSGQYSLEVQEPDRG